MIEGSKKYYFGYNFVDNLGITIEDSTRTPIEQQPLTQEYLMTLPESERHSFLNIISRLICLPWFLLDEADQKIAAQQAALHPVFDQEPKPRASTQEIRRKPKPKVSGKQFAPRSQKEKRKW